MKNIDDQSLNLLQISLAELADHGRSDSVSVNVNGGANAIKKKVHREDEDEKVGGQSDSNQHHDHCDDAWN